jgi:hypothetical protein
VPNLLRSKRACAGSRATSRAVITSSAVSPSWRDRYRLPGACAGVPRPALGAGLARSRRRVRSAALTLPAPVCSLPGSVGASGVRGSRRGGARRGVGQREAL